MTILLSNRAGVSQPNPGRVAAIYSGGAAPLRIMGPLFLALTEVTRPHIRA